MPELSEYATRIKYIDKKIEQAGWQINRTNGVIERNKACVEIKTTHMPITSETPHGNGYCDYVLFGPSGLPLAVIEAKKTSVNEEVGRTQACLYADSLEKEYGFRPVIYYTNGFSFKVIDGIFPDRKVFGIHSLEDLERIVEKRTASLSDKSINPAITDRYYQQEAINKVLQNFESKRARSLIVLATGTGKTRVSCSLTDIFLRNDYCKRILFLADRKNLVKQAKEETFDVFLPSTSSALVLEGQREIAGQGARLVFATYQSMLSIIKDMSTNPYSIGHFDLIVVDEAHRSLFNKYAEIFDYFDSLMIGLTATPRKEIHKSTYKVFNIDDDTPNYEYDIVKGVHDGYLTYFRALDRTPDILKNGLIRDNLSEEEKERYDDLFSDEGEEPPEQIEGENFYSTIMNIDTIRKVLKDLMEEGIYSDNGNVLGKTIIFAKDKQHADLIVSTFKEMFPELCYPTAEGGVDYIVAIYDSIRFNEELQRQFKVGQKIRIVVSVDMMDTGVDVRDVVNLVFFKKVLSSIKFWQMVGRGTRICSNVDVLSPAKAYFERTTNDDKRDHYVDKTGFLIFDICGVFHYFDLHPEGRKGSQKTELSLNQKIYLAKCRTMFGLQRDYYSLDQADRDLCDSLRKELCDAVKALNNNYIGVQSNIAFVEKYREIDTWHSLTKEMLKEIEAHIAPLIQGTIDIDAAKKFDYITYLFMDSRHNPEVDVSKVAKALYQILVKGLLEGNLHRPEVKEHEQELIEASSDEYFNNATPSQVEEKRKSLRGLMKYIIPGSVPVLISDFTDFIIKGGDADGGKSIASVDFMPYEDKVYRFVKESIDTEPYASLHSFRRVPEGAVAKIKEDLTAIDVDGFASLFKSDDELIPYCRKIVGIAQLKINEFVKSYKDKGYSILQQNYIRELLMFISQNGSFERRDLLLPELTFEGILNSEEILFVLSDIEGRL